MQFVTTTKCHALGCPELQLAYDPAGLLEADAVWFASVLEEMVLSGSRFAAGQTLQVGWSIVWFKSVSPGLLAFEEPDMRAMPIVRQPGLTLSLAHLRLQKDTLESVLPAEALSFPSLLQSCLVCRRLRDSPASFIMDRTAPDGGADSGWFIGCDDEHHAHDQPSELEMVLLFEAVITRCRGALPYLAFPTGTLVVVDGGSPRVFVKGKERKIRAGSYLEALASGRLAGPSPRGHLDDP